MDEMFDILRTLRQPANAFQVLVLWLAMYGVLRFLRGSAGLGLLRGLLFLGLGLFFVTELLSGYVLLPHLELLLRPSQGILILILGVLILFQPEIRRAFIRLGENKAFEGVVATTRSRGHQIAAAAERLSRRRVGALVVIERSIGLRDYMEGAIPVGADLEPTLLESIFQPGGPLHDGAVIVRGDRIVAACCLLPLSENTAISPDHGTRHRAAVGVSEKSDALAVVVSEETGGISYAYRGELVKVEGSRRLASRIDEILLAPAREEDEE